MKNKKIIYIVFILVIGIFTLPQSAFAKNENNTLSSTVKFETKKLETDNSNNNTNTENEENNENESDEQSDTNSDSAIIIGDPMECKDIESTKTYAFIKDAFYVIQILVPIILIGLGSLDFVKAIIAQSDDQMKQAQSTFVKRLIISIAIFLMPSILDLLFGFITDVMNITTCGIGTK